MHLHINPTPRLSGTLTPPSSKSQNIRGVLFAALSRGQSMLYNPLISDDTNDVLQIVKALGININWQKDAADPIVLNSTGIPFQTSTSDFYSGNSGLTTLFSMPLLGFRADDKTVVTFDCGEQMRARPVAPLVNRYWRNSFFEKE